MSKKYEIKTLPVYDSSYTGDREMISIHRNPKGSMMKLSANQNINFLAVVDFIPGNPPRGNHYHLVKDEFFYILEGKVHGYFSDMEGGETDHLILEAGTMIHVLPGCVHAFTCIEKGYGMEFTATTVEEMDGDSYPRVLVE